MAVIGLRKTDKVLGPGLYTQLLIDSDSDSDPAYGENLAVQALRNCHSE